MYCIYTYTYVYTHTYVYMHIHINIKNLDIIRDKRVEETKLFVLFFLSHVTHMHILWKEPNVLWNTYGHRLELFFSGFLSYVKHLKASCHSYVHEPNPAKTALYTIKRAVYVVKRVQFILKYICVRTRACGPPLAELWEKKNSSSLSGKSFVNSEFAKFQYSFPPPPRPLICESYLTCAWVMSQVSAWIDSYTCANEMML